MIQECFVLARVLPFSCDCDSPWANDDHHERIWPFTRFSLSSVRRLYPFPAKVRWSLTASRWVLRHLSHRPRSRSDPCLVFVFSAVPATSSGILPWSLNLTQRRLANYSGACLVADFGGASDLTSSAVSDLEQILIEVGRRYCGCSDSFLWFIIHFWLQG
jgi:hypothetical protein